MAMTQVNVTINGRSYRMACEDGQEEHLTGLAAELDGHIERFKETFGEVGDMRLLVMGAITLADELAAVRRRVVALEGQVRGLDETRAQLHDQAERAEATVAEALEGAAERLERLSDMLSRPMSETSE